MFDWLIKRSVVPRYLSLAQQLAAASVKVTRLSDQLEEMEKNFKEDFSVKEAELEEARKERDVLIAKLDTLEHGSPKKKAALMMTGLSGRPLKDRMVSVMELASGPFSAAHLSKVLDANLGTVRTALQLLKLKGKVKMLARNEWVAVKSREEEPEKSLE